jgi:hypothetical protein
MAMTGKIEGAFLPLTEEQAAIIYEACREEGFPESGAGIVSLLMLYLLEDAADDEEPPPYAEKIREYLEKHPNDIALLQGLLGNGGKVVLNYLKKRFMDQA